MTILFKTTKLADVCCNKRAMIRELGPKSAKKLMARLADIQAAASLDEVKRGRPHLLKGSFQGCVGLDLDGGARLVIEPATSPLPTLPDGGIDFAKVDMVCVVFLGDYHD